MRLLQAWIAAVLLSVLGYLLLMQAGWAFPPLRLYGVLTQLLGVPAVFQLVHAVFGLGQGGKIFAFSGVTLLWLGGLTLLGGLQRPLTAGAVTAVLCLLLAPWQTAVGYGVVFAALLWGVARRLTPAGGRVPDPARRSLTGVLAAGAAALAGGGLVALFRQDQTPADEAAPVAGDALPFAVTPVEHFYYVSKNLEIFDPRLNVQDWSLQVGGLVQRPATFRLSDLAQFPAVRQELTLSCISNPVGGPLISNGLWEGFRLADLLRQVGIQPQARYVLWEAADGYTESLPLGQALEPDVLLVTRLNGQPLTQRHGFPLRVLIPGRYGMKQPRWITGIRLSATDKPGYWAERGWSKEARVELMSRIDQPSPDNPQAPAGPGAIRGVAFYGNRPVTRVEVSTDNGQHWQDARLVPPRSRYAWTPWELLWTPAPGTYSLMVRAYSGATVQTPSAREALPEGATGYHQLVVTVS
ncbi:molybdopterin-dependent oxidoreductase [Deinococcus sonorensis]|uniref:Molybdopterin-dependent oxidoreductase n=2 Tax=Deinococcus sonorensis TaxID=309891 RepID=A0AAU7UBR0_9DEIO